MLYIFLYIQVFVLSMKDRILTRRQKKNQKQKQQIINIDSQSNNEQHELIKKVKDNLEMLLMHNKQIQQNMRKQQQKINSTTKTIHNKQEIHQQSQNVQDDSNQSQQSSQQQESIQFNNLMPVTKQSKKKKPFIGLKSFFNEQITTEMGSVSHQSPSKQKNQGQQDNYSIKSEDIPPEPISDNGNQQPQNPQKRKRPQNQLLQHPKPSKKIPKKLLELEQQVENDALLKKPTEELQKQFQKIDEKKAERKKEQKKMDYLIEKKYKEMKIGKKKDRASNQVFNAIEDYFM